MLELVFDMSTSGTRVERLPKNIYSYLTVYNNSRFDMRIYRGNTTNQFELLGACPAYTLISFPFERTIDYVRFAWEGVDGINERAKIYLTENNLGLVGQFRPPTTTINQFVDNVAIQNIHEDMNVRPGLTPTIFNVQAVLANTEYVVTLPANTKKFSMFIQENDARYRIAFQTGRVATPTRPFILIPAGGSYSEDNLRTSTQIFFASEIANKWLQVIAWV